MMGRQNRLSSACCTSSRSTNPFHINRESACNVDQHRHSLHASTTAAQFVTEIILIYAYKSIFPIKFGSGRTPLTTFNEINVSNYNRMLRYDVNKNKTFPLLTSTQNNYVGDSCVS